MAIETTGSGDFAFENKKAVRVDAAEVNTKFRWLILLGLILAAIMEVLDTTIVNVALPQMSGNLGTTTQEIAWVSTGYILSNVVVLPMTAFLNARFGRRNYLTASIILFTIASFFCGASHSLGEIVFWRILQGAGGAALISTAQATLVQVFPPEEQSIVQPLFLMGLVVAPTVGPSLGGWITDTMSWSWCFYINIPIGILAGCLVMFFLHDTTAPKSDEPIDWLGIGLLAVGLGSLQYVLEEGQQDDWFNSNFILRLFILSLICLGVLVYWQLHPRNTHPVVKLRLLKNRSLTAGIILFIAVGFGLYGVTYLYPLMAQTLEGMSSLQTGLALLPGGLATAFSIVFCGVISTNPKTNVDARLLTLFGIGLSICAMWALGHLNAQSGVSATFWPMVMRGFTIGFLFVPVNTLAISSLTPEEVNQGTGLLGLARQLGGSIGLAILATYLQNQIEVNRANLVSYVNSGHQAFNDQLNGFTGVLLSNGHSLADAQHGALGLIDQSVNQQAAALSFNEAFILLMFINIITAPSLLLLRKVTGTVNAGAMH
jgi:DHA2 family multidrug resistance protein